MGIFGATSLYDSDVERATGEGSTSDDWVAIMHVCDRLSVDTNKDAARECLKAILKRMKNMAPHVALQALTLLDACEKNCGRAFRLEVASRMFEDEVKNLLSNARVHPAVREKLKLTIKQWAHDPDIIGNPELKLIPDMYKSLAAQGYEFPKTTLPSATPGGEASGSAVRTIASSSSGPSAAANTVDAETLRRREEEEFARAVALSIREAEQSGIPVSTSAKSVKNSSPMYANLPMPNEKSSSSNAFSLYGNLLQNSVVEPGSSKSHQPKDTQQVKFGGVQHDGNDHIGDSRNERQTSDSVKQSEIPTDYSQVREPKRCRVLYDFEAVESDELTLKAGEIVLVNDDSDASWWNGSNPRGEGLFPANFVTDQLDVDIRTVNNKKSSSNFAGDENYEENEDGKATPVQKNEIFTEPLRIDEAIVDQALALIHNADLTGERPDDMSLGAYESRTYDMNPLIDAELEQVDRQHLKLTQLGHRLFEAIKLYHETMAAQAAAPAPSTAFPQSHAQFPGQHDALSFSHPASVMTPAVQQYQHQNSYPSTTTGSGMYWPQSAAPQHAHAMQQQQHTEYSPSMPPVQFGSNAPSMQANNASNSNYTGHQQQSWMPPQDPTAMYGQGQTRY